MQQTGPGREEHQQPLLNTALARSEWEASHDKAGGGGSAGHSEEPPRRCCAAVTRQEVLGYVSLLCMILCWVLQAEYAQSIQKGRAQGAQYNKPFFMTWFNQSCMVLALPVVFCYIKCTVNAGSGRRSSIQDYLRLHGFTPQQMVKHCVWLGVLYFFANYLWYLALPQRGVSVGLATAVYNTCVVFTWLFGLCILGEPCAVSHVCGMVLSVAGVFMVSLGHKNNGDSSAGAPALRLNLWYLVILGGAALYGLWEVAFKALTVTRQRPDGSRVKEMPLTMVNMFSGGVGAAHIVVVSFGLIPLHFSGVEPFQPPTAVQWKSLLGNAGLSLLFNLSFVASVALLPSPVFVAMATLLTIPTAAALDILLMGPEASELAKRMFSGMK